MCSCQGSHGKVGFACCKMYRGTVVRKCVCRGGLHRQSRGSPTSFVTAPQTRSLTTRELVVIAPVARSITGFVCIRGLVTEKMLQKTFAPRWPATQSELLTAPGSHRSSSQPASHHSHPEHVRIVQMFTLVCITLHPYYSNILFWEPDSNPLMFPAPNSHFTALFNLYS
jgi:hypothetical protein